MGKFNDDKELLDKIKIILADFECENFEKINFEIESYKNSSSLKDCIKKIYKNQLSGKENKYPHQARISPGNLKKSVDIIQDKIREIDNCKDFDQIYSLIEEFHSEIKGLAELTSYDAALRIGFYKNIYPDKVYIHCGVKEGVKSLKNLNLILEYNKVLERKNLAEVFKEIPCYKLEKCFCGKKKEFKELEEGYTKSR